MEKTERTESAEPRGEPVETLPRPTVDEAPAWYPNWSGQTCVIVASGPSAIDAEVGQAKGKVRAIAVNNSWRLAPWADVLYACDFLWWKNHKGVPEFEGLKVSQDLKCAGTFPEIKLVRGVREMRSKLKAIPGVIAWGGNGGFQAINLAVQFGTKRLILVGFDMRTDLGLHWHGKHDKGLNNPSHSSVAKWRDALDGVAGQLAGHGVSVFNASPVSALKAYPKMTLAEALEA